jgi:hypothetical protein
MGAAQVAQLVDVEEKKPRWKPVMHGVDFFL